jgi:hypothetical protein
MNDPRDPSRSEHPPEPPFGAPGDAERFWQQFGRSGSSHRRQRAAGPPPAGNGGATEPVHDHECLEWCPICRTAEVVRSGASPELREQFQGLQRDAVVAVKALLDAYLERIDDPGRRPGRSGNIEDIPIR